jgi:hypothetical protein
MEVAMARTKVETDWSGPDIKRLKLSLAANEWMEVACGGRSCRLRVVAYHGGHARLEIDGPLEFAFVRATAAARRREGQGRGEKEGVAS